MTATAEPEAAGTTYVVLSLHPDALDRERPPGAWHEVAVLHAHSADHAIRQSGQHGVLVAVPERSWKPRKVTTETKTVLKLEDA